MPNSQTFKDILFLNKTKAPQRGLQTTSACLYQLPQASYIASVLAPQLCPLGWTRSLPGEPAPVCAYGTFLLLLLFSRLSMNHHAFWDIVPSVSLHLEANVLAHTVILSMVTTEILSSMILTSILF